MKKISMIIVTMPGTWQKVLHKNIASHSSIEVIGVVHGGISAVQMVKEHAPDLLLIDASIPIDEVVAIIENVRLVKARMQCIVLADTQIQRQKAVWAGADYALSSFNYSPQITQILADLQADANSKDDGRQIILDGE